MFARFSQLLKSFQAHGANKPLFLSSHAIFRLTRNESARVPSLLRRLNFGSNLKWGIGRVEETSDEEDETEAAEVEEGGDWRVYDEETLLERMQARRTASERELASVVRGCEREKSSEALGMLFTPTE